MLNHLPPTERRRATRQKRNFKVRIKGQTYSGLDISQHGFSIMVTDNYINFALNQILDSVYITNLNTHTTHCINQIKVASKRGSRYYIYGFSLVDIDANARQKHQQLAMGNAVSNSDDTPTAVETSKPAAAPLMIEKQFLLNLMSATKSTELSDADFRRYVKSQLIKLAKNQPLK